MRNREIPSRVRATDAAIVAAVDDLKPRTVLDLGCGEGWLAHALAERGYDVLGVDAIPALIEQAKTKGKAAFEVAGYEQITESGLGGRRFDAVVINFALFGEDSVPKLLRRMPDLLKPGGRLVIQTLHPVVANGDQIYADGWRKGSWAGFSDAFTDPAPWYFRTLGTWVTMIGASGLAIDEMREPVDPQTGKPASVIFIAKAR
ncbi:MAG: class I SAM-dependent methyltransferase [Rhodospirillaceae bacterium]|nr:class I SAM-dependent methyltransferase [Rhodospirillaceae bacterium]